MVSIPIDNPVQLPACDKKCWLPSTNGQFQYEVESNLTNLLDGQYGEVENIIISNLYILKRV